MKALLAVAIITALWAEWPRGNPSEAIDSAPEVVPAATPSREAPGVATTPSIARRSAPASPRAPAPSPSPSASPPATEVSGSDDSYNRKVQAIMRRQQIELNDFLLHELKLDLHAVFEFHQAMTDCDSAITRESLVMHARDDWRQSNDVWERLTRERNQKFVSLMSKAGYEDYLAFLEKQRKEMGHELGWGD